MRKISLLFVVFIGLFSCVPMKKYRDLEGVNDNCQKAKDSLRSALDTKTIAFTELEGEYSKIETVNKKLEKDTASLGQRSRDLIADKQGLEGLNEHLIQKQSDLAQENAREAQEMLSALQTTRETLQLREDALADLADSLGNERKRLEALYLAVGIKEQEIAKRDQVIESKNTELQELSELIRKKDSLTHSLRTKIASALLGFEGAGLTIIQKNGKVYISLDESLLFEVGQSKVAPKGVEALQKLAAVLEANKDMEILVEGHTDNTGSPIYNWKLSTERALSITHILLGNSAIEPVRVTAAGRGQFSPLDIADTPEARKKNRRSEIILTPNLDELFGLINDVEKVNNEVGGDAIDIKTEE